MTVLSKVLIKKDVISSLGNDAEDTLEAARLETAKAAGGVAAFKVASQKVQELAHHVDLDFEETDPEKMTILAELDEEIALKVMAYTKRYITRAAEQCNNLQTGAELTMLRAEGAVAAAEAFVKKLVKQRADCDSQIAKIQRAVELGEAFADESGEISTRPPMADAAADLAARRAEAAERRAEEEPDAEEPEEAEGDDELYEDEEEPEKEELEPEPEPEPAPLPEPDPDDEPLPEDDEVVEQPRKKRRKRRK